MCKETKKVMVELIVLLLLINYNIMFIPALIWVLLHEAAHILVSFLFGCKFINIKLHVFGVKAQLSDMDTLDDSLKLIIYSAGSAFNFLVAIVLYFLNIKYNNSIIEASIWINVGLAIFNLLPACPLDGSKIAEILLLKKFSIKKSLQIISSLSYLIATIFIAIPIGIYLFLHTINFSMLIGGLIIIYITKAEKKKQMYVTVRGMIRKRERLLKNKYIENKTISIYYKMYLVNVLGLVDRDRFSTFYILDDDVNCIDKLNEDEIIEALKLYGNITVEEYLKKH